MRYTVKPFGNRWQVVDTQFGDCRICFYASRADAEGAARAYNEKMQDAPSPVNLDTELGRLRHRQMSGDVSFERTMPQTDWTALHRATRGESSR